MDRQPADQARAVFIEGRGAAWSTQGVLPQLHGACDETSRTARSARTGSRAVERERVFIENRLEALRSFAAAVDAGIEAFGRGEPITPQAMQVIHIHPGRKR